MSHHRLYFHIVFAPIYREPVIIPEIERKFYAYIVETSRCIGAEVLRVNSMPDHVHILIHTGPTFRVCDYVRDIKRSTSMMLKQIPGLRFRKWARGYSADTVSFHEVETVRHYIQNQKEHHRKLTFAEELKLIFGEEDLRDYDC